MAIEIKDASATQTTSGQPVNITVEHEMNLAASGEANTSVALADDSISVLGNNADVSAAATVAKSTPVTVDIAPEALRQITTLSSTNRKLVARLKELEQKMAGTATSDDITAKLKRVDELEALLKSPRAYLKASGKTLEDVAADALADDNNVADPRVDALTPIIDELKKKVLDAETARAAEAQTQTAATIARQHAEAAQHVANVIASSPDRWTLIKDDKTLATDIVKAAILVIERDHKGKTVDAALADSILKDCLDEAETYQLAKKMVEDRKKAVPATESLVKRKGLEVQDSDSYTRKLGDDGKNAGTRIPKVTIDGNRGALRAGAIERGPTDVRTARARALRIASGHED